MDTNGSLTTTASPHRMTYTQALDFLYARNQFAMKLGLENIAALLEALGRPQDGLKFLHVAGTNGKGSVCANSASLLSAAGYARVGLYTSPHLVSFRERIQIDGRPIEKEWIVAWMDKAMPLMLRFNSTYFECVTAMALGYFREQGCEAVVLETGLGGRLDATNIVRPVVTVITSISLDHTHILGSTVEEIWREKAAILKPATPMVVREDRQPMLAELEANAKAVGSPVHSLRDFPCRVSGNTVRYPALHAFYDFPAELRVEDHQRENLGLALLAVECFVGKALPPAMELEPGLRGSRPPGRTQLLEAAGLMPVLLDGAHNLGGVDALAGYMRKVHPGIRVTALFSVMKDKDYLAVYRGVRAFASQIRFVPLGAQFPRALAYGELRESLTVEERDGLEEFPLSSESLERLLRCGNAGQGSPGAESMLVVCGSLYLLGEVIPLLIPHYRALDWFRQFKEEN